MSAHVSQALVERMTRAVSIDTCHVYLGYISYSTGCKCERCILNRISCGALQLVEDCWVIHVSLGEHVQTTMLSADRACVCAETTSFSGMANAVCNQVIKLNT